MPIPKEIGKANKHLNKLESLFTTIKNDLKLSALKSAVVAGGDGSSTVTGIAPEDTLIGVINLTDEASVSATISAANTISYSGDLSTKKLFVLYLDVSALTL